MGGESKKVKAARRRWEKGTVPPNRRRRKDQLHTLSKATQLKLIAQEREQLASLYAELAITGSKYAACRKSGIPYQTVDRWYKCDPEFRAAYDAAMEEAAEMLEAEARRRAVQGVDQLKFDRHGNALMDPRDPTGETYYVERTYSDALLAKLLDAARPEKYRARQEIRHTTDQSAEVYATRAERLARLQEAEAAIEAGGDIVDVEATCVTDDTDGQDRPGPDAAS